MPLLTTNFKPKVYVPGEISEFGVRIVRQLMWHDHYIVFLTKRGIAYEASDEVLCRSHELLEKFNFLAGRIDALLSGTGAARIQEQLAIVLCDGFDRAAEDQTPRPDTFAAIEVQIDKEAATAAKTVYVVCAGGMVLIAILSAFVTYNTSLSTVIRLLIFAGSGGASGAFLSLLIRLNKIQVITEATSRTTHAITGIIRIMLGVLGGVILFLAVRGNIFLGQLNGNTCGLLFGCVAAGFVEHFIPEMLVKFVSEKRETQG